MGRYVPVNPTASPLPPPKPVGRPRVFPDRVMTGAERVRRHRYYRGWTDMMLKKMLRRHPKPAQQHNWNRNAPTDILANELAGACFDWGTHKANRARWAEINKQVLECFNRMERDFAGFVT